MLTEHQLDQLTELGKLTAEGKLDEAQALANQIAAEAKEAIDAEKAASEAANAPRTRDQVTFDLLYALSAATGHTPACQALLEELSALLFPPAPAPATPPQANPNG